ncbi:MAG: T9SS type A sorting domain-containing protein [Flavobacteriales bacterium]
MKTHLLKYIAIFLIFIGLNANAQTRYIDNMFDSVTVTSNVAYGQNISILPLLQGLPPVMDTLLCDIYEPKNDTLTDRPVIVLIHTGSFLPPVLNGQATGSKNDNSIVENCMRWAKKGYVAVAMTYRQGWNPTSPSQAVRTATILQAAYRGIHDTKAMVRYLRKTVAEDGNSYGIDDSKIVVGGQGTGAYLSMGYITLDTVSELFIYPKFWDTSDPDPANHVPLISPQFPIPGPITYGYGNIDGTDTTYYPANFPPFNFPVDVLWNFPNNPSYSNDVSMAFNLGGTLADLDWLDGGQVPHVSFHCENDPFASIDEGVIIVPTTGDIVIPDVIGSRVANHYNTLWGNNSGFNQAGLNDTLSQISNSYNSNWNHPLNDGSLVYDGLYVFDTPAPDTVPNAFGEMPYHESSPWDWWDLATYDMMFAAVNGAPAGYGAANSLLGSPNSGSDSIPMLYLDTIHGYLNPRMYEVLGLGGSSDFNEVIEKTTQVYPNPAKDNINIVSYAELINSVDVYNLSGQKVLSKKVNNGTTTKLNTSGLSKGVYIIDVKSRVSSVKKKVIIE